MNEITSNMMNKMSLEVISNIFGDFSLERDGPSDQPTDGHSLCYGAPKNAQQLNKSINSRSLMVSGSASSNPSKAHAYNLPFESHLTQIVVFFPHHEWLNIPSTQPFEFPHLLSFPLSNSFGHFHRR